MLQNLKGFRDLLPEQKRKKDFVINKLKKIFEIFGFEPIETPTLEYANLLLGKYGAEADKLIYAFEDKGGRKVALKYDQTVPTTRFLFQYQNQLPRFFRRYQIQNVFRAEKPQKGRWREFTQCDIDIFGTTSPIADAEIIAATYFSFVELGLKDIKILINDRKILFNCLQKYINPKVDIFSLIQSLDKLEKIGETQVIEELKKKGLPKNLSQSAINDLKTVKITPNLEKIINCAKDLGVKKEAIIFSSFLARGLDYYTGMILEVIDENFNEGSLAGGGRYDNLVKQITGIDIPAVGLAFGLDRIFLVMESKNLFPPILQKKVLITLFEKNNSFSLKIAKIIRQFGLSVEIYPNFDKLEKQLKYADKNKFDFVIICGEEEIKNKKIKIKKMKERVQEEVDFDKLENYFKRP